MATAAAPKAEALKLPDDYKAAEPVAKGGTDKDGKPDESLSTKQSVRALVEAYAVLSPQPSRQELESAIEKMEELSEDGQPKVKCKTAKEATDKGVAFLNEGRKAA